MNNMLNSVLRQTARSVRGISLTQRHSGRLGAAGARWMCSSSSEVLKNVEQIVKKDKVVVFMKGTPAQPMCGFSNAVVQILRMHGVEKYTAYNVLENQELRQGQHTHTHCGRVLCLQCAQSLHTLKRKKQK